jgi:adenine-specific DNA-methyltransferase
VAEKDSVYKKVKEEVNELMGKIEETVPVKMPMKDGFKANAAFFKLGFLDKRSVARGRQLQELLPLLWMKAGAKGECPSEVAGDYVIWPNNHMALLKDEANFRNFYKEIEKHPEVETVFLITDSQSAYLSMIAELKGVKTYQLYRDYLENFRINYAAK